jgi:MFS family permease
MMSASPVEAPAETLYPPASRGWYVVAVLLLASMFSYLDRSVITLLVPMIRKDLGLTDTQFSLLQGLAFAITFAIAGLPLGRLVDRANRRLIIAAGVAVWSLMTVLCGLSTSFWQLFAARMGVGIGEACLAPAAASLISDYFARERRGRVMGVMQAGTPLGSGLAKMLGGVALGLVTAGGAQALPVVGALAPWQTVFVLVGAPGFLAALLVLTIREPARRERARLDRGGAGVGAYLRTHTRTFVFLFAAYAFVSMCGYANTSWSPVIFMRTFAMPPAEVGVVIGSVVVVAGVAAALSGGVLSDLFARRRPEDGRFRMVIVLLLVTIAAFLTLALSKVYLVSLAAYGVASFATFAITSSAMAAIQEVSPNEYRGQLVAINLVCANLIGLGLAPTAVAVITDYGFGDDAMLQYALGAVTVPAALLALIAVILGLPAYRRTRLR